MPPETIAEEVPVCCRLQVCMSLEVCSNSFSLIDEHRGTNYQTIQEIYKPQRNQRNGHNASVFPTKPDQQDGC